LPERRTAGIAGRGRGATVRGAGVLLLSFAVMAIIGAAAAREWRSPWRTAGVPLQQAQTSTLITVAETPPAGAEATGVDIRIADLMAGGSELAGVAPRPATSGIGSDVELDLFSNEVPLNAPDAPAPENDKEYLY
jgi:hypothetical protein